MTARTATATASRVGLPRHGHPALRVAAFYVPTLLVVVTLVFALPRGMPGDPLSVFDDPESNLFISDAESRDRLLGYYGLDDPLPVQFVHYLSRVGRGDLGWSIARNAPVSTLIARHLPWTLLLMGTALVLAAGVSFLAGVTAAWRRRRALDRALLVSLTTVNAVPEYALAAVLLIVFAVVFPVLPLYGARTPFADHGTAAAVPDVGRHLVRNEEGLPDEVIKPFETSDQYGVLKDPGNWNLALHFNLAKGFPYSEARFRQAVAYAVDRQDMVDRILLGRGKPGSPGGLAPAHPMAAGDLPTYKRDVAKAKSLLDELGLKDSNGDGTRELPDGTPFRQEVQTSNRFTPKSAELLKEYLREVGIDVEIKSLDRAAADAAANEGHFSMALVGYGGIMGDPETLTTRFSSKSRGGGFSRAKGYANPQFDTLAQKQLTTLDEAQRKQEVIEMQKILANDLPVLSLYVPDRVMIYRKGGFSNWYFTPGCSPCGATGNKHMLVTGLKTGFRKVGN